jgi:hypothetical protein
MVQKIPLALSNRQRPAAAQASIIMRNRFVEKNPVLSDAGPAFVQRPALNYWTTVGDGPIRNIFQQPGAFNDDAFAASYDELYRLDRTTGDGSGNYVVYSGLGGADANAFVPMCATGDIGTIKPRLFFCDGAGLFAYTEDSFATGVLTGSAAPSDGDVVQIDGVYYRFSSGTLDAGAPAGTAGNPWRVLSTGTLAQALSRLYKAINATGAAGTDYSTALVAHTTVVATGTSTTTLTIRAVASGATGNGLSTTETGANLSWGGATTAGGGSEGVVQVPMPEDVGVLDVATLNNFVFVVPAQGEGLNGRFYWIEPGELTIDPLNFATAERSADPITSIKVFNDQFWLMGQNTTEVWYMTGDAAVPVQRLQGVVFDRGIFQGTAVQVKDSIVLVDSFGGVFQLKNGEQRISSPDIEEHIRKAIAYQNALALP